MEVMVRVVVVGGGAAGLTAAHLLDPIHEVILLEREPILGGHVRTLGGNVAVEGLGGATLDAGVIEFEATYFPDVFKLFARLGVALGQVPGFTTMFTRRGFRLRCPGALDEQVPSRFLRAAWKLYGSRVVADQRRFLARTEGLDEDALRDHTLGHYLGHSAHDTWLELLALYAYSTPRPHARALPAALAVPMLRDFVHAGRWFRVVGGVYAYMEAILDRFSGRVETGVSELRAWRHTDGVRVEAHGDTLHADALVFAAPPDQALRVLQDPDDEERRRFAPWRARHVQTVVHRDVGVYARRGSSRGTEFDVFDLDAGRGAYNACLDRLCGVRGSGGYGLAFGLEHELDPASIVHVQPHHTPWYEVASFRWRDEVRRTNGHRHTWHAGAWLGDGLHQGAIATAAAVSRALGGAGL